MSRHTVTFNAERDLVEIDFRDRFVTENILAIIHALKALPDADRFRGVLWDLREADLSGLTIGTLRDVFRMKNEESRASGCASPAWSPARPTRIS